jgi:hypothetical protein
MARPGLRLLVTSQAPLRLAPERVLRIDPLAVPEAALPAAEALGFGAVALFAERARAIDQRFAVTAANTAAVIETCRALDGLPLAIELAASRAPLLGMKRLLAAMRERFRLLTAGRNRAAPARQQALRSALEWSCGLLEPREQQLFRRLGVVAGSASLPFLQRLLVGDDGLDDWAVVDALDTLVDRSLVAVCPTGDGGEPRYRLLESPRAYALERLEEAGERPALQRRHALVVAGARRRGVRAALQRPHRRRRLAAPLRSRVRQRPRRPALGARRGRGRGGAAHRRDDAAGAAAFGACRADGARRRLRGADLARAARGAAAAGLARAELRPRRHAEGARTAGRPSARSPSARRLDDPGADRFMLYHALCRAGSAAAQAGDLAAARPLLDEARRSRRRLGRRTGCSGSPRRRSGSPGSAATGPTRCSAAGRLLALDRERGSHAAIAMGNLIDAELAAGDAAAAARLGRELVDTLAGTRHEYSLGFARINLLAALLAQDDVGAARRWRKRPGRAPSCSSCSTRPPRTWRCSARSRAGRAPRSASRRTRRRSTRRAARPREQNETEATTRPRRSRRRALDDATAARLHAEGAGLRDAEVGAVAFGDDDA